MCATCCLCCALKPRKTYITHTSTPKSNANKNSSPTKLISYLILHLFLQFLSSLLMEIYTIFVTLFQNHHNLCHISINAVLCSLKFMFTCNHLSQVGDMLVLNEAKWEHLVYQVCFIWINREKIANMATHLTQFQFSRVRRNN